MWQALRQWRGSRRSASGRRRLFQVWRKFAQFRAVSRELRRASLQARKQKLHDVIDRAARAASKDQMGEIYRITKFLAPKQRRERVVVRASDGSLLRPQQQFQSILDYFQSAFSDTKPFHPDTDPEPPCIDAAELQLAVASLKTKKAVPITSAPPEVWKALPDLFATSLARDYHLGTSSRPSRLTHEITDCSLLLLPKPHKSSRLPKDLRPIGVQDPASKLVARVLRDRLTSQVADLLHAAPQFAYVEGKSIDSAIMRVIRHCRETRARLQAGALSVHARAAGEVCSSCYGSVMIGIDLSRAFDNLTRDVLQRSLRHAGVDPSLQRILLEIHCQCSYELQHHQFTGAFPLDKGVRQGCAVSPMLYSLFTVWLMAELKTRVPPQWVDELMTCFADDTHLAWRIHKLADLALVCRTVREVFDLLADCGMVANADKSSVVLGLRGTSARKWIRAHTVSRDGQPCINFGVPGRPILIPRVAKFGYLGVQVSYGSFEMQTFLSRQQAASSNRARLAKLLHSKQLSIRRRVSLYMSCVRSSLIFGLHATGLTDAVLRKLSATDSRHLRAIARSPAHITHESTAELRRRLRVVSPEMALVALLRRRTLLVLLIWSSS